MERGGEAALLTALREPAGPAARSAAAGHSDSERSRPLLAAMCMSGCAAWALECVSARVRGILRDYLSIGVYEIS